MKKSGAVTKKRTSSVKNQIRSVQRLLQKKVSQTLYDLQTETQLIRIKNLNEEIRIIKTEELKELQLKVRELQ